jgi:hypothetical protein
MRHHIADDDSDDCRGRRVFFSDDVAVRSYCPSESPAAAAAARADRHAAGTGDCCCRCLPYTFACGANGEHTAISPRTAEWLHWAFDPYNEKKTLVTEVTLVVAFSIAFAPLSSSGVIATLLFWLTWEALALLSAAEAARRCPVHSGVSFLTARHLAKRAAIVAAAIIARFSARRAMSAAWARAQKLGGGGARRRAAAFLPKG